jgi:GDSL-like Lipase/Acylhydrolase family
VLRELRAWPTLLLVLFCLGIGVPAAVALTPGQDVVVFGQHITVGARAPELSLAGPAQLVQVGNTKLDVERMHVYGPLRPRMTLGPVQRNADAATAFDPVAGPQLRVAAVEAVTAAFLAWYGWGAVVLLAFTLAAVAGAAGLRVMLVLRRQSRVTGAYRPLPEIWTHCRGATARMSLIALAASMLAWTGSGALAYAGAADGLRDVGSLSQLVGAYHWTPAPVGPVVTGYDGVVIGDSRAGRVGGPPLPDGTPDDVACERSTDSLAAEIGRLQPARVLNLACPGATVPVGLRGSQERRGLLLPAQLGLLQQVHGLRFVVVAIGPNDLGWADFLRYCYGAADCGDNLTQGEFDYRLAAFDRGYGDLLVDLDALPGRPQVIVVASYDVFRPGDDPTNCPDARPAGVPGLDPAKIELLAERNAALNAVLAAGAEKYGFAVARAELRALCATGADGLGPDLQGLNDPYPFHPSGIGSLRVASAVVRLIAPNPAR